MRRILLYFFVILLMITPISSAHAQVPLDTVLQRVKAYMQEQIGRDFVIVNYTYQLDTWQNAGLGCPAPGVNYVEETVQGYSWSITIDRDDVFEVHSNLDGTLVVICTAIDRSVLIDYQTYQGNDFVIDYPETWESVAETADFEAGFFPGGTATCETPGMTVQRVDQTGVNPSLLINEVVRQEGLVQSLGIAVPIGDLGGQTLTYQVACDEATLRQTRTSAFPLLDGSGAFVVKQWSPVGDFTSWDEAFIMILRSFNLLENIVAGETPAAGESLDATRLLAGVQIAHNFVDILYLSTLDDLPGIQLMRTQAPRRGIRFSPDGKYLIYIEPNTLTDEGERLEMVEGVGRPLTLAALVAADYPAVWSPSGDQIAYLVPGEEDMLDIYTTDLTGSEAQLLASVPAPDGCENPETPYLPEQLYWAETGPLGNFNVFYWLLDNRLLLSTGCNADGLAFITTEGELEPIGDYRRAALSANKLQVAMLDDAGNIVILNLESGESRTLELDVPADQLAWGSDGSVLYYSTTTELDTITIDDPQLENRSERLFGVFPYKSMLNAVTINSLNIATGESTTLWRSSGYAVGRLASAPNGVGLFFSFVPDDRVLAEAFRQNLAYRDLRFSFPETQVYWLPPSGGEAQLLLYTQAPVISPAIATEQN